jgi:hypothetical protein
MQPVTLDEESFSESLATGIGNILFMDRMDSVVYCTQADLDESGINATMSDGSSFKITVRKTG